MIALLWIHNRKCRTLVKDGDRIVDSNDAWDNRASAELSVNLAYPESDIEFVTEPGRVETLNREWQAFLDSRRNNIVGAVREFWAAREDLEHALKNDPVDARKCLSRMLAAVDDVLALDVLKPGERMPTVSEIEAKMVQ